ncbi:MAG: type IV-A pilus assembly ATPase PilB [Mariprofundaceae bacterium]|nr:type IV-A pilus assembly ATPase PilB [Mariprofundaceae bacterium]
MKVSRLSDILLKSKKITPDQQTDILRDMRLSGDTLIHQLVHKKIFDDKELAQFISKSSGRPLIDLDKVDIPRNITKLSIAIMRTNMAIPIQRRGSSLTIAVVDPYDIAALDEMAFISGCQAEVKIVTESQLMRAFERIDGTEEKLKAAMADLEADDPEVIDTREETDDATSLVKAEEAPIVKLVNLIFLGAVKRGASDIHIEPYEKILRVRYRIDGVLQEIMQQSKSKQNAIVSRIKVLATLDISERRLPQDGRIKLKISKTKTIDFRVSILPTLFGEKVVMRLLDASNLQLNMADLGYAPQELKWFREKIHQPYGMVLVTGPTGSGKTVSLYSAIAEMNKPDVNICTAEDPVEFNFMGINQVNINVGIGLTFPIALRSFLRQDPDIVLIGEIRDQETAEIGIKAALTGHLVLATLHTNDAPSTMTRLINMGIESFLVGSAVEIVTAQRLARTNCKNCTEPEVIPIEALIEAGAAPEEASSYKTMHGVGCSTCNDTGYKGRTGLYQVMPIFPEIREAVYAGKNSDEITKIAVKCGVQTLRMAALGKVKEGKLSLEECLRVTVGDE